MAVGPLDVNHHHSPGSRCHPVIEAKGISSEGYSGLSRGSMDPPRRRGFLDVPVQLSVSESAVLSSLPLVLGYPLPDTQDSGSQPLGWVNGPHPEAGDFLGNALQGSGPSYTWEASLLPNSVMGMEEKEGIFGVCVNINCLFGTVLEPE